jgi:limonene-1,2-epoxide hydrolase
MDKTAHALGRRAFVSAGLGAAAAALALRPVQAAGPTDVERANMQLVKDFCAAWPSHDLDRIVAFFADNGSYRMTEAMEPTKGRDALIARIKLIVNNVNEFEILDTWARGPMVINERVDRFTNFLLKSWHGVGVFLIKESKIVEWYDYTIESERA